jgi:hypothetical protein
MIHGAELIHIGVSASVTVQHISYLGIVGYDVELCYLDVMTYNVEQRVKNDIKLSKGLNMFFSKKIFNCKKVVRMTMPLAVRPPPRSSDHSHGFFNTPKY